VLRPKGAISGCGGYTFPELKVFSQYQLCFSRVDVHKGLTGVIGEHDHDRRHDEGGGDLVAFNVGAKVVGVELSHNDLRCTEGERI
jgi:hypothetical protein